MDRKKSTQKSKTAAWVMGVIALTAIVFGIYGYQRAKAKKAAATATAATTTHEASRSLIQVYKDAWASTNEKAYEIQHALEENEKLRNENANLRVKIETLQFVEQTKQASTASAEASKKLLSEGGTGVARTLASIEYKPPGNLLPSQLYTLGVTYFKAHEDEKAAVIFSFLTGLEDNAAYRTARNYLQTGVAWYRLSNFEMADHYFDLALQQPDESDNLRYQAQARLWRSLVAKHAGKKAETQYWLRDLLDHHPQSREAAWVNSQEAHRATASNE
jgi:tetratricopeptide (TPR) repeat protein